MQAIGNGGEEQLATESGRRRMPEQRPPAAPRERAGASHSVKVVAEVRGDYPELMAGMVGRVQMGP